MKLTRSKIFLICCLVFILGIGIASFLPQRLFIDAFYYFVGSIVFLVLLIIFWERKKFRLICFIGLFLFLGIWRFVFLLPINTPDKIWHYNNQTLKFTAEVYQEVDLGDKSQKVYVEVKEIQGLEVTGKVLLTTDLYPRYRYGEELEIECELSTPGEIEDFAYDRYLARYDIYSVCYYPEIFKTGENHGNWLNSNILKLKNKTRDVVIQGSREPYTSLIRAIVLGDKREIPEDLRILFAQAGISHVMAISGMHIGILVVILMWALIALGLTRKSSFYVVTLFLFMYLILIGIPASALRACLMGFLVLWAMYLGRLNRLINSLIMVAAGLLFFNPKLFRDDIGFQLSFLALLGIVLLFPCLRDWSIEKKIPKLKGMRDIFFVTITAQIFTTPIIVYNFSQFSIIAPIVNLLVLWTLPFLLVLSILAIVLSFIFPPLAFLFFLPSELILGYIIKLCEIATMIPFSYVEF